MSEAQDYTGLTVSQDYKRRGPNPLTDRVGKSELGHLIKALAIDPDVVKFGWAQYTPYFNDGETCVFGVRELRVQTTMDEDYDYDQEVGKYHPTLGSAKWVSVKEPAASGYGYVSRGHSESKTPLFPETAKLAKELNAALQGAEVTLLEWFGDHAEIIVTSEGITVDEYEHD